MKDSRPLTKARLLRCPLQALLATYRFLFLSVLIVGCNESGPGGEGMVALAVTHSRSSLASSADIPDPLRVETFRVVISGDDFSPPVEAFFSGDTVEGEVTGVPIGKGRTVLIEALNAEGKAVRRREIRGVEIVKGEKTSVQASLVAVPLITSPAEGSVVTTTRLRFEGYGEPASGLTIVDHFDGVPTDLADLSTASNLISPSLSDGSFLLTPATLLPGLHTFEIRDRVSGYQSSVSVTLVLPGRFPGRWAGGMGGMATGHMTSIGISEPFGRGEFVLPEVIGSGQQ